MLQKISRKSTKQIQLTLPWSQEGGSEWSSLQCYNEANTFFQKKNSTEFEEEEWKFQVAEKIMSSYFFEGMKLGW